MRPAGSSRRAYPMALQGDALARFRVAPDDGSALLTSLRPLVRVFVRREVARQALSRECIDDVVQEVLLRAGRGVRRAGTTDTTRFVAWIWGVAHHVVIDVARHDGRRRATEADWPGALVARITRDSPPGTDDAPEPETVLEASGGPMEALMVKEQEEAVAEAISQLTQRQRDLLMQWVIQGETIAALARRHQVSRRSAKRDVDEALALLEKLLARDDL